MSFIIKSGIGNGKSVGVSSGKRLYTDSITETIQEAGVVAGETFNVATGVVNLTTDSESCIFYLRNLEDRDLLITSVFINTNNGAGSVSGQPIFKVYRNPISGSIITNAVDVDTVSNSNFGSALILSGNIYKGVEGDTIGDASAVIEVALPPRAALSFAEFNTRVVLPRGAAYAVSYKPEAGTTNLDIITGVVLTKLPEEF